MLAPWLAAWLPNIVLGHRRHPLFKWRGRVADRPMRVPLPAFLKKLGTVTASGRSRFFAPLRHARSLRRAHLPAHARPVGAGAVQRLLHLDVHRADREGAQGRRDVDDAVGVPALSDAAVSLLHHPAVGAAGDAGHRGAADEEQRARRHEGVRDQPVSRGDADGGAPRCWLAPRSSCSSRPSSVLPTAKPKRSSM